MRGFLCLFALTVTIGLPSFSQAADEDGWQTIFDGKTLEDWDGNPKFWSVQDGAITGKTTKDNPAPHNTFIIWKGGEPGNFELKCDYKIIGHNSGIQYRSFVVDKDEWVVGGYQADMEAGDRYSGILYGEKFRGILADRGLKTEIGDNHKPKVLERFGDSAEIQKKIKKEDWNSYHIIADGFHFTHYINGVKTSECIDSDKEQRREKGIIALQLHQGPPMTVQFKNIRIRPIEKGDKTSQTDTSAKSKQKVVFIAGTKSHGYGSHEHKAGCILLAKALEESGLPVETEVVTGGWPKDSSVLNGADSIVIYADGGGRHPFNEHIDELNKLTNKGVGIVCIHYGVEVPEGKSGDAFLDWTGGYFEANWSVNPHWDATYDRLPNHPITNGVKPFTINDEWYYHMRFRDQMQGVTPILTDLPPKSTLKRPDGAHSGNPYVREEIANGVPQHMAWARERPDGGRGFGFTGGHFHWNWGNDQFRKLVLNAIAWTAHVDVPEDGVPSKSLTVNDLMANQDYDVPDNFNKQRIAAMIKEWNR
jgi:type 1 glutamine amidotransferase